MSVEKISRNELVGGNIVGVHKVEEPVVGFKKIICRCQNEPIWTIFGMVDMGPLFGPNGDIEAVATVEIPTGSSIVRSNTKYGVPSNKLRTDKMKVNDIETTSRRFLPNLLSRTTNCECFSYHDRNFIYKKNDIHTSNLCTNLYEECEPGLHFFLSKKEANNFRF